MVKALVGLGLLGLCSVSACISVNPGVHLDTGWMKNLIFEGGAARGEYVASFDDCWLATRASVDRLGLRVSDVSADGIISGTMHDDTGYSIELRNLGDSLTEVRVKVGTFGDQLRSDQIHRAIQVELARTGARPSRR